MIISHLDVPGGNSEANYDLSSFSAPSPDPAQTNTFPSPFPSPFSAPALASPEPSSGSPQATSPLQKSYSVTDAFGDEAKGLEQEGYERPSNQGSGFQSPQIVRRDYGQHINGVFAGDNSRGSEDGAGSPGYGAVGGPTSHGAPSWGSTSTGIDQPDIPSTQPGARPGLDYQYNEVDDINPKYRPEYPQPSSWRKHTNQYSSNKDRGFRPQPQDPYHSPLGTGARRFDAVAPDSAERLDYVYDDLYQYDDEPKPAIVARDQFGYRISSFQQKQRDIMEQSAYSENKQTQARDRADHVGYHHRPRHRRGQRPRQQQQRDYRSRYQRQQWEARRGTGWRPPRSRRTESVRSQRQALHRQMDTGRRKSDWRNHPESQRF